MHQLGLYINNTLDTKTLQVTDISLWDVNLDVKNPVIKINIPDCNTDFYPVYKIKGSSYYTSNTFNLTDTTCAFGDLPDGIYSVTLSVCPNDIVYINFKFLRDQVTRGSIFSKLSQFVLNCDKVYDSFGKDITNIRMQDYKDLLQLLDMAQIDVKTYRYTEAQDKLDYVNSKISTF